MHNPKQFFAGKSVTVMGLDPNGRGLQDAIFLAGAGAHVTATDLKSADELKDSVEALEQYENVELVLGEHRMEDFENKDFIIRAASAPFDSKYLKRAEENNIPIEIDETLFLKYAPKMTVIGVTGTRGKSTVTHMIHHVLQKSYEDASKGVHIAGNVRGTAALPLLTEVEEGDVVVMELSSWQLQGFGHQKISPEIAVFTTFMEDHMNYYDGDMERYFEDKSHIYRYQYEDDALIVGGGVAEYIGDESSYLSVTSDNLPVDWELNIPGEHNLLNAALAAAAAREAGVPEKDIKDGLETFSGVEGRLEYCGSINGIDVYNDNNATTQDATTAAIYALQNRDITLVTGGADKGLEFNLLTDAIAKDVSRTILLTGTATDKLKEELTKKKDESVVGEYDDFEKAIGKAFEITPKGGVLLFSPAAASFNMFDNEYERNDRFKEVAKRCEI